MNIHWFIPLGIVIVIVVSGCTINIGEGGGGIAQNNSTTVQNNTDNQGVSESQNSAVLENVKKPIVWVRYDVIGRNYDGSYFANTATGSGVIYFQNSTTIGVYTNRHVVDCSYWDLNACYQRFTEVVSVRTQDGVIHTVQKILFGQHGLDIAVLQVDSGGGQYIAANLGNTPSLGDAVTAVGYPAFTGQLTEFTVSTGKVTNFRTLLTADGYGFNAIDSDAYTYFGSSGGGLFDSNGNLVGINTWLVKSNISVAADVNLIKDQDLYTLCYSGYYSVGNGCVKSCSIDEVLGRDGQCYQMCSDFYCNTEVKAFHDPHCKDDNVVYGTDGYCHKPCGTSYCSNDAAYCLMNRCYAACADPRQVLYKDGTCRYYQ